MAQRTLGCRVAAASMIGAKARHGPHHAAEHSHQLDDRLLGGAGA